MLILGKSISSRESRNFALRKYENFINGDTETCLAMLVSGVRTPPSLVRGENKKEQEMNGEKYRERERERGKEEENSRKSEKRPEHE